MTRVEIFEEALKLPVEEQLRLAQRLWENLSPPPSQSDPDLSAQQRQMLETRRAEALADPESGVPWEEAKARILADR